MIQDLATKARAILPWLGGATATIALDWTVDVQRLFWIGVAGLVVTMSAIVLEAVEQSRQRAKAQERRCDW